MEPKDSTSENVDPNRAAQRYRLFLAFINRMYNKMHKKQNKTNVHMMGKKVGTECDFLND